MKIVLDANVVVAAFAARGLCESLFEYCLVNHEILLSEQLLGEVCRNLSRKLKLPRETVDGIERLLRENGSFFQPVAIDAGTCRDDDDLHVLGLIRGAGPEFLVTGDEDLLVLKIFEQCRIVTPRELWSLVQ